MDTRESLAKELAEERMADEVQSCQEGGVPYKDIKLEDFLQEAFEFVDRCIATNRELPHGTSLDCR